MIVKFMWQFAIALGLIDSGFFDESPAIFLCLFDRPTSFQNQNLDKLARPISDCTNSSCFESSAKSRIWPTQG